MKTLYILIILLIIEIVSYDYLYSKVIEIGPGKSYSSLSYVSSLAKPGDTLLLFSPQPVNQFVSNIHGTPVNPIVIKPADNQTIVFDGGSTAIQFSDISYIIIQKLTFKNQIGNGLNIDDGGTFETPTSHIVIEDCIWLSMNASGNNDQLKMSGVNNFHIRNCKFASGSAGGSMIDMVGCHSGIIETSRFSDAGSNCIQAKGGCDSIIIRRNNFVRGGQRAINIGGSTGMEFFRPLNANFEASNILVYSNIFWGGITPAAFVGAYQCTFANNTIINPEKWCLRILQENNNEKLLQCSYNYVENNIFYFPDAAASPVINIGPNTKATTFTFSNNLWFNFENTNFTGINSPVTETGRIVAKNPNFVSLPDSNLSPSENSPAIGNGKYKKFVDVDYNGNIISEPFSIGAIFVKKPTNVIEYSKINRVRIFPNPSKDNLFISSENYTIISYQIFSVSGEIIRKEIIPDKFDLHILINDLNNGAYFVRLNYIDNTFEDVPFLVIK